MVRLMEEEFGDDEHLVIVTNPLDSMIATKLRKYIQTAEPLVPGPFTGHIPVSLVRRYGYSGIMLNHSEFKLERGTIGKAVAMAREYHLETLVCAADIEELNAISRFRPDMIAYEPPDLIGGEISVSAAKPEIIEEASKTLRESGIKLVVGAGIKNAKDVKISRRLGAEGVLVASGVVKSKEPIKVIGEMLKEVS
ncbi:MAG: triose-phosphate isomerase [Thermoplasmata archaeon]